MEFPHASCGFPSPLCSQAPAPKVWPVSDGAWQIRLPLPWALTSVNVFLFRTDGGDLLLDTGIRSAESLLSLDAALKSVGSGWSCVSEILVSHLHPDHIGAAAELRRRTGAPVRMPEIEAELVKPLGPDRSFFAESAAFLRQHGMPGAQVDALRQQAAAGSGFFERLIVDGAIEEGERIAFHGGTLEAIAAPGHSPGQLCFFWPERRVLFSTDAILPRVTPNIGVHWFYQNNPLGEYLATLGKLHGLDAERVVPSHGRPFEGHREWIDNTKLHHGRRCDSILDLLGGKPLDAFEIAGAIWGEDRSLFDRRFGMAESLAHLAFMELKQRVAAVDVGGVTCWTRT